MFNSKGIIRTRQAEGRQRVSAQPTTSAAHPFFSPAPLARGQGGGQQGMGGFWRRRQLTNVGTDPINTLDQRASPSAPWPHTNPLVPTPGQGCGRGLSKPAMPCGRVPTPVFWPGEFYGLYSPLGRKELNMTKRFSLHKDKRNVNLTKKKECV